MRTEVFQYTIDYGFCEPETHKLFLTADSYKSNNSLAVIAYETPKGECVSPEMFDVITVNIFESDFLMEKDLAYVDTNNCPWAAELLKETGLATPVGTYGHSGFCSYPLYKFNLEKFNK